MKKDRLTQFGVRCRELRARYSLTMGDQAKGLEISAAYISAIERGKRPIPSDYPEGLANWLSLSRQESDNLLQLALGERTVVKVFPSDREQALLAEDFAQQLNGLSPVAVKRLRQVLESVRPRSYTDDQLRQHAYMARAAFSLGEVCFDVLRVIENHLPMVDKDFSLQIEPDGSLGEFLQVYSESNGRKIERTILTEWLYQAACQGTDDSRFKLAHEIAHWMLHPTESHTFLRSARTKKYFTRLHSVAEREADFFAREFLMPLEIVERFVSPETLAKGVRVPLWVAKARFREVSMLRGSERNRIGEIRAAIFENLKTKAASGSGQSDTPVSSAAILQFPSQMASRVARSGRKAPSDLPLFDYAETHSRDRQQEVSDRSDIWFREFGWRG